LTGWWMKPNVRLWRVYFVQWRCRLLRLCSVGDRWKSGRMNGWMNEWMNERMNEWTNEWMNFERCRNDTGGGALKYTERNLSHCHFVRYKFHINWPT
jgi:hypothetical protein